MPATCLKRPVTQERTMMMISSLQITKRAVLELLQPVFLPRGQKPIFRPTQIIGEVTVWYILKLACLDRIHR
jgi:hypothetical protein